MHSTTAFVLLLCSTAGAAPDPKATGIVVKTTR
jgi:hypothetical protein